MTNEHKQVRSRRAETADFIRLHGAVCLFVSVGYCLILKRHTDDDIPIYIHAHHTAASYITYES